MLVHTPLKANSSLRWSERLCEAAPRKAFWEATLGQTLDAPLSASKDPERSRARRLMLTIRAPTPRRPSTHLYAAVVAASSSSPQPWRVTARPIALRRNTIFAIFFTENMAAGLRSGGLAGEAGKARTSLNQSL